MGTRSMTVVTHDWDGGDTEHNATIYRHWDGYLSGHGRWLADFLKDVSVTNGEDGKANHFNGPGRLASGIVAALQMDGHNPDLMDKGSICGQEYEYRVHVGYGSGGGKITVKLLDGPMTFFGGGGEECTNEVFSGTVEEFNTFIEMAEDPVAVEE